MDKSSELEKVTLHVTRKENTNLKDAIEDFTTDSFAILYSPSNCHLALFKDKQFAGEKGRIDVSSAFEARIFNKTAELRWLKNGDMGTAVILSEEEKIGFEENISTEKLEAISQKYLIWGQSTGKNQNGWTQFGTARIGSFYVPVPNIADKDYAQITAVEYLRTEKENGNIFVADERLTGIKSYQTEEN